MRRAILTIALAIGVLAAAPVPAHAADIIAPACQGATGTACTSRGDDPKAIAKTIADTLLFILGIVSVIMIIIGGFRYVLSAGDAAAIKSAKNTVFYAVIGLAIALLSFTIVNFVIGKVG